MFLKKSFWIGQNTRAIAFHVLELLREDQQGMGEVKLPQPRSSLIVLNIFCKQYSLFKDFATLAFLLKWPSNYSSLLYGKILAEIKV